MPRSGSPGAVSGSPGAGPGVPLDRSRGPRNRSLGPPDRSQGHRSRYRGPPGPVPMDNLRQKEKINIRSAPIYQSARPTKRKN